MPIKIWLTGFVLLACAGCAQVWVDDHGRKHVLGLVDVTLPASGPGQAQTIDARIAGVLFTRSDIGASLAIGLSHTSLTVVPPDTCMNLGPPGWISSFTSRSTP